MLHVYILPHGWVILGERTDCPDPDMQTLKYASVVRRWGTDAGLGQLASDGPRTETILDQAPEGIAFPFKQLIMMFPCSVEPWQEYLDTFPQRRGVQ